MAEEELDRPLLKVSMERRDPSCSDDGVDDRRERCSEPWLQRPASRCFVAVNSVQIAGVDLVGRQAPC